ncbi:MAG: hypothetical protein Q8O59_01730 [bacterium]|nr:hypothetical protein [bacterium]
MAKENFMPKGLSKVEHKPDGTVERIIAVCEGKKILIVVQNGQPKRRATTEIPYFAIPEKKFHPFYRQIRGIISDGKKRAKKFKDVKKIDWADNLEKCGITIGSDGKVTTYRWSTNKKTGVKKRIPMPAKDIGAAIRMQYHIMKYYDQFNLPPQLNQLLKKLAIVQPILELRSEQLIYARDRMQETINQAFVRLNQIGRATADVDSPKFDVLADKIAQLIFLLKNQWACPYLHVVKQATLHLGRAKRAAAKHKLQTAQLQLLKAKLLLASLATDERQAGKKISEIDPVMTLGKIHWLGKTDEILAIAKRKFTGRQFFKLAEMLTISRMVIEKEVLTSKPTASAPTNYRPVPAAERMAGWTEQISLNFGA